MGTALSISTFNAAFPELDVKDAEESQVTACLNEAEAYVSRSSFSASVPTATTLSQADRAVLLVAAHLFVKARRSWASGLSAPGQVTSVSHADGRSVSFRALGTATQGGADLSRDWWLSTDYGARYQLLLGSKVSTGLPFVVC